MLEDGEAPFRLNLIDDVADTDRPKEHRLAFGAADRLSWRAAWPQDVVCHWTSIGLVAAGHEAAVDVENRAGDPAGLVGEQIGDGVGDVGGGADSPQWMKRRESVKRGVDLVLRDEPLESGGLDDGRC